MSRKKINLYSVFFIVCLSSLLFIPIESHAVPAAPDIFEIVQPDGNIFNSRIKGDEWNNWVETVDGYSIEKGVGDYWYYILFYVGDTPVLSNIYAHASPPMGLGKHIRQDHSFMRPSLRKESQIGTIEIKAAPVGTFNGNILFILAEFSDRIGTYTETSFASFINNNISDYFDKASYGAVTLSPANETFGTANNGVVGWVDLGYPHPDTRGSTNDTNRQLTYDAILAADDYVDFSAYDTNSDGYVDADELAVVVLAAGYETAYGGAAAAYTPNVWGHKWSLGWGAVSAASVDGVLVGHYNNDAGGYAQFGEIHQTSSVNEHQATMGIMIHELGHLIFGLPDLYDTDGSSYGIGIFGVMASGSWGRSSSDTYSGETPVLPCAWTKYNRGWVDGSIGVGSTSFLAAGSTSATSSNTVYRLPASASNEYFLIENRQPFGYDRGLERSDWLNTGFGGLAIWHIDSDTIASKISSNTVNDSECWPGSAPSCAVDHYGVVLEQADDNWDLEQDTNSGNTTDLWYSGNVTTFDAVSAPDSYLYDGSASSVTVTSISASGETMTATLSSLLPNITVTESVGTADDLEVPFSDLGGGFQDYTVDVNNTSATVDLTDISTSLVTYGQSAFDPFTITDGCTSAGFLAPGTSCQIDIRFEPTSQGSYGKVIRIYSDDPDEPEVVVSMCGNGVAPLPSSSAASNNDIQSPFSSCGTGLTNSPPSSPELVYPIDGLSALKTKVTFRWKKSTDPDGDPVTYDLYYCEDQDFSGCEPQVVASHRNSRVVRFRVTGLNTNTRYYWKVIAKDDKGAGRLSETRSFTTKHRRHVSPW